MSNTYVFFHTEFRLDMLTKNKISEKKFTFLTCTVIVEKQLLLLLTLNRVEESGRIATKCQRREENDLV